MGQTSKFEKKKNMNKKRKWWAAECQRPALLLRSLPWNFFFQKINKEKEKYYGLLSNEESAADLHLPKQKKEKKNPPLII